MDPVDIPESLSAAPQQLVALVGLDVNNNPTHRNVADSFCVNRRPDRLPLHFRLITADHEFPRAKPKRSYDALIPRGILKTNWAHKYLEQIPAVVVLFIDLNWNHPSWNEKKFECQSKVNSLRHSLEGRGTRLAVVLIQTMAPLPPGEDVLAAERATELCSACDLSPKSLFVFPLTDHLFGYILRLEHAFHELAQAFYQGEIRRVKSKKELLSKAAHQALLIRCQFKAALLSELRQDSQTALRHYKLAYQHLAEAQLPEQQWYEWKTVAGLLTYKVCRLCFQHNTPLDSIAHFRRHIDFFRPLVGRHPTEQLARIEHHAWLSKQHAIFAELFDGAVHKGLAAVQTQHPGIYFQNAAEEAMRKKRSVQTMVNGLQASWTTASGSLQPPAYPTPDPLAILQGLEFFGQRPWRLGLVEGTLTADEGTESAAVLALELRQQNALASSTATLPLLNAAMAQFKRYNCPRTKRHMMVLMADEYLEMGQFAKALQLYGHVVWEYRMERWWPLLISILYKTLTCAFCLGNVKDYVSATLELLNSQIAKLDDSERGRLQQNLLRLLGGEPPLPEPGLSKGTVDAAMEIWHKDLTDRCFFMVQMKRIHACVQARAWFLVPDSAAAVVNETVRIKVALRLLAPLPMQFRQLKIAVEEVNATAGATSGDQVAFFTDNVQDVCLNSGDVRYFDFSFRPNANRDVGKQLIISSLELDVGHLQAPIYGSLQWEGAGVVGARPVAAEFATGRRVISVFDRQSVPEAIKIVSRPALATVDVHHGPSILVGEIYDVHVRITNKEVGPLTSFRLLAGLDATSSTDQTPNSSPSTFFFLDPTSNAFVGSFALELPDLPPGLATDVIVKCCSQAIGDHTLRFHASYRISCVVDGDSLAAATTDCACSATTSTVVQVLQPFAVASRPISLNAEPVDQLVQQELSLIHADLQVIATCQLVIESVVWQLLPALSIQGAPTQTFTEDEATVSAGDVFAVSTAVLPLAGATIPADADIGQLVVTWRRRESTATVKSRLALPYVPLVAAPVLLEARLPAFGAVRQPVKVEYTLRNVTMGVLELQLRFESTDLFMFAGDKQIDVRLLPGSERRWRYVLFPLVAGHVALPRLRLSSPWLAQEILDRLAQRSLPTSFFVLPFGKRIDQTATGPTATITSAWTTAATDARHPTAPQTGFT